MTPELQLTLDMHAAIQTLRVKRARFVGTREGVEIHQPGKPVLLLTYESARRFAQEIEEAAND